MMGRLQGPVGPLGSDRGDSRGLIEVVAFGIVAFVTILLIAASSISFEPRQVQPPGGGETVPVHVVMHAAG